MAIEGGVTEQSIVRKFIPDSELRKIEEEKILADRPKAEELSSLAKYIRDIFENNKRAKLDPEQRGISILRRLKGEYEPDKLAALEAAGMPTDFIRLTSHKARDCESWTIAAFNQSGDRTWDVVPEDDHALPPDVEDMIKQSVRVQVMRQSMTQAMATQQTVDPDEVISQIEKEEVIIKQQVMKKAKDLAEERATNMEQHIMDQLKAGGWDKAFKAIINDFSRLPCCVLKGPTPRRKKVNKWKEDPQTGQWSSVIEDAIVYDWERISFFDYYPSPKSMSPQEGPLVVVEHLERKDILKCKGMDGYKDDVIDLILKDYEKGNTETTPIEAERFKLEHENTTGMDDGQGLIDSLDLWGDVPGKLLIEWKMQADEEIDPLADYQVNAKMVNDKVWRMIVNPDPLGDKPYYETSFSKTNDSQFGECPADLMEDIQNICNQAVRSLVKNVSMGAGPLTVMDIDLLAAGQSPEMTPHKTVQLSAKKMKDGNLVQFYQTRIIAQELLMIYDKFKRESDDQVVPSYGHGNPNVSGAGRTKGGLEMLMNMAQRNIDLGIENINMDIVIPAIQKLVLYNMLFSDEENIKGNFRVKARNTTSMVMKDQLAQRKNQFRQSLAPEDRAILGERGVAYLLKENLKDMRLDPEEGIPGLQMIEKGVATPQQGQLPAPQSKPIPESPGGGPQ